LQAEDIGARNIGGHQVGRELDARKGTAHALREGAGEQRFGNTGDAFDECVVAGEDHHQRLADDFVLADDHPSDLAFHPRQGRLKLL
jgi:hypothetical protein